MTLVNETPRRESEVRRPKVKGHTGGKSGKLRQRGSEARFHREAEGLQVWGKGSVRNSRRWALWGSCQKRGEPGFPKSGGGAQAVPGLHTCTKLLSKTVKSRSWSNSPLCRRRCSRPGRPVGQAETRVCSGGSSSGWGGLSQEAGPGAERWGSRAMVSNRRPQPSPGPARGVAPPLTCHPPHLVPLHLLRPGPA